MSEKIPEYDESKPVEIESWMQKANIKTFERWQRRLFRLQGRNIFYFKKEKGEPPCGYIPLVDVEVVDLKPKKGRNYGFSINIKASHINAKRNEYLICADNEETRKQWKEKIAQFSSKSLFGLPLVAACSITPTSKGVHTLLPYFMPPVFRALNESGYLSRSIWTIEPSQTQLENSISILNQNYPLPLNDLYLVAATIIKYLQSLPDSLIPSESMFDFMDKITVENLREKILELPANSRELFRLLGEHFKKILDNTEKNGVTQFQLMPIFGPIFIRQPAASPTHAKTITPAKAHEIQNKVAQTFFSNLPGIIEDIHQFTQATRLPILERCRVSEPRILPEENVLDASKGLLVSVVKKDYCGWCTVYTSNKIVGLIHESSLKKISKEELDELNSGPNIDSLFDVVREKAPELVLLFDSMLFEISSIRDSLDS
ncbi:hypothetical protein M9Y10_004986 [Tritrichomonas musculus]|uniref:RhoGAP domain containing protein n=1 Tax=Tritrichomonas musculus TaxID=1915356 RepID=A0ABR2JK12_9EUKA